MPRQRENFQLLAQLGEFRIGGNQRSAHPYRKLGRETVGQSKFVPNAQYRRIDRDLFVHRYRLNSAT
jgi:hypothetical protein